MGGRPAYCVFVIGGENCGGGIARDAGGRGYSVFLGEMKNLASGTSSKATKRIRGEMRSIDCDEFRLVGEVL